MKKLILSLFLMLWFQLLHAQKYDVSKSKFEIQYVKTPSSLLLSKYRNYTTLLNTSQGIIDDIGLKPEKIEDCFNFKGFVYDTLDPQIVVALSIAEPKVMDESIVEKKEEIKKQDGTKETKISYVLTMKGSIHTKLEFIDLATEKAVKTYEISTASNPSIFTSSYAEKSSAEAIKAKRGRRNFSKYVLGQYHKELSSLIKTVKEELDYSIEKGEQNYYTMNEKKAPNTNAFNKEVYKAVNEAQSISYSDAVKQYRKPFDEIIKKWESEVVGLSSSDKNERKFKFAYLYNLALAYYIIEDFDKCMDYCVQVEKNDFKSKNAFALYKQAKSAKEYMASNGTSTRHLFRHGFVSETKYEHQKAKGIKALRQLKSDVNDINSALKSIKDNTYGAAKKEIEKLTLGDTIDAGMARFSTLKFKAFGKQYDLGEKSMKKGKGGGYVYNKTYIEYNKTFFNTTYAVKFLKSNDDYDVTYFNISFQYNSKDDADKAFEDLFSDLKNKSPYKLMDVSHNKEELGQEAKRNYEFYHLPIVKPEQNKSKYSADIRMMFNLKDYAPLYYDTKDGTTFEIELVEANPIVVRKGESRFVNGYMAKFKIPKVELTRMKFAEPHGWFSMYENQTIEDLEFYGLYYPN